MEALIGVVLLALLISGVVGMTGFAGQIAKLADSQAGLSNAMVILNRTLTDPTTCINSAEIVDLNLNPLPLNIAAVQSYKLVVKYGTQGNQQFRGPASGSTTPVKQADFGIEIQDLKIDFPAQTVVPDPSGIKTYFAVAKLTPKFTDGVLGGSAVSEKIIGTVIVKTNAADVLVGCGGTALNGSCSAMNGVTNPITGNCELDKKVVCPVGQIQTGNSGTDCVDPQSALSSVFSSCPAGSLLVRDVNGAIICQNLDVAVGAGCKDAGGNPVSNGLLVSNGAGAADCRRLPAWNANYCANGQVLVSNGDGTSVCRDPPVVSGNNNCGLQVINNCSIPATLHGNLSVGGTCAAGFNGPCNYTCSNGNYTEVQACTVAAPICVGGASTTVTSVAAVPAGCYCPVGETWNGTSSSCIPSAPVNCPTQMSGPNPGVWKKHYAVVQPATATNRIGPISWVNPYITWTEANTNTGAMLVIDTPCGHRGDYCDDMIAPPMAPNQPIYLVCE